MAVTSTPGHNKEAIFLSSGLLVQSTAPLLVHFTGARNIWNGYLFFQEIRLRTCLLCLFFVILPHSCSFLHKLEMVVPEAAESQEKPGIFPVLQAGREHLKLCLPWLDWRNIEVPTSGCEAQIQEMILSCGSTACANMQSMLCARCWSYPLPFLGEGVSVTEADTSFSLSDVVSSHLGAGSSHCPLPVTVPFPRLFLVPGISSIPPGSGRLGKWFPISVLLWEPVLHRGQAHPLGVLWGTTPCLFSPHSTALLPGWTMPQESPTSGRLDQYFLNMNCKHCYFKMCDMSIY